ncbi:gamma carbonic anhydrase family protein [Aestuariispira ectoiniformans]|uniref:gamma carbonic anhydrase family protein n=1 Tax=Aestuariispira ectoiniformans TaxID=2775080 RepID=UPI00223B4126|nr:gamma carbonic anhydrase family protein [Aestuariispira ectoiniformans]
MPKNILPFEEFSPIIHETAFVAPSADIIGNVEVGADSGIWYGCVLRGDVNEIRIGARTNIQDGTIIHVATHGQGTYIGDDVSVGHMAIIHACTLESGSFVGMKACVMDGALVESGAMVAAGALVPPGRVVKSGELWAGVPAKAIRELGAQDKQMMEWTAPHYVTLAKRHKESQT